MATGALSTRVDDWLYSTLSSGVPGVSGPYADDTAPGQGLVFPYVRYQMLSGNPTSVLNGTRIITTFVYLVEAIGKTGTWHNVESAADAIYTALHQQTGSVAGAAILSCVCEEERRLAEESSGVRYRRLGWSVRIEAMPT